MHALQDKMLIYRNALRLILRRRAPSQEDNAIAPHLDDGVDDLLCEHFPALAGVGICLAAPDS